MAHSLVMAERPPSDLLNFLQSRRDTGPDDLRQVLNLVSKNKPKTVSLKNPPGAKWMLGDLEDTLYRGNNDIMYELRNFYLRDPVKMHVVGTVDGMSYPCDELVLLICDDGRMYVYDGEELHVAASSLEAFWNKGIEYPPCRSYYHGEAFEHMTEKDWDKVKKGPVGKKRDEAHHRLVTAEKDKFLKHLAGVCN